MCQLAARTENAAGQLAHFAFSYLLIDPLAYWQKSILSHWYINFMAIIDIIILVLSVWAWHRFYERFYAVNWLLFWDWSSVCWRQRLCMHRWQRSFVRLLTDSMTVAQVLAFIVIWMAVPLIFTLVASLLTRAMEAISLGWLNRWLGSGSRELSNFSC